MKTKDVILLILAGVALYVLWPTITNGLQSMRASVPVNGQPAVNIQQQVNQQQEVTVPEPQPLPNIGATVETAVDARMNAQPVPVGQETAVPPAAVPMPTPAAVWAEQPSLDSVDLTNGQLEQFGIVPGTGGASLTPGQLANCAYAQSTGRKASPLCPPNAAEMLGQGR